MCHQSLVIGHLDGLVEVEGMVNLAGFIGKKRVINSVNNNSRGKVS